MKIFNAGTAPFAAGLMVILAASGCGTRPPPDALAEASAMGERPVAMKGEKEFFDGQVLATVTLSRGIGRGSAGGNPGGGPRGGRGGGHAGAPPDMGEMDPEQAMAYRNARLALGSPLPPVTTRLKLENRGKEPVEIEILEVNSDLGNFAVRPAKLTVAPGQTAEPDPMISQLGVTSDEIAVKVTLRKAAATAGAKPSPAQTEVLAVVSLKLLGAAKN